MKAKTKMSHTTPKFKVQPATCTSEQGLTLVESVVSLLIFFVALAGIVPIFLNSALATINNEKKTAAVAISGQILDELRQFDTADLPSSNTVTSLPSGTSIANVSYMGKTYNPTITYCQNTTYCDANSRHIKIQVSHNGQSIYEAETVFTRLE